MCAVGVREPEGPRGSGQPGRGSGDGAASLRHSKSGGCYLHFQSANTLRVLYTNLSGPESRQRLRGSGQPQAVAALSSHPTNQAKHRPGDR